MSTHVVEVISVADILPHPNADKLELIPVNGWQVVVRKGEYKVGQLAVYIQPDYVVPTDREEFAFLAKPNKTTHRLKAIRLRGELSFGLLIPVPEFLQPTKVGNDVMDALGIVRYEPPEEKSSGLGSLDALPAEECPHDSFAPKFDLESYQNYPDVLEIGEEVVVTEKIHGSNARYLYDNGTMYLGSRRRWLKPDTINIWSRALDAVPEIIEWCRAHPGVVLYGEVFGAVQSLRYGLGDKVDFRAFAACDHGKWHTNLSGVPSVPVVYAGPFHPEKIFPLAETDSIVGSAPAGHMKEGLVIVPSKERFDRRVGRVALKYISNRYWTSEA